MGKFLEAERKRQAEFKRHSVDFSDSARHDGLYKGKMRDFALPLHCAAENLYVEIRDMAQAYFSQSGIGWHSLNHLCSSQVCCVNFLFPFMNKPDALAVLLRPLFPNIRQMLPLEAPSQYVAFEWIGQDNYLGEKVRKNTPRTRGANFTSADAMVMFEHTNGLRQIVLIEWKYTESYTSVSKKVASSGTDRSAIYAPLYQQADCPLDKSILPAYDDLFYEPFYQFMRQQFLAHEMERVKEFQAGIVSLLHIAPTRNAEFGQVTSPNLRPIGGTVTDIWKRLVKTPDRFMSVSTESLFGKFSVNRFPELMPWYEYVHARYSWLDE